MGDNAAVPQPKGVLKHAMERQDRRKNRLRRDGTPNIPNNGKGRPFGARVRVTAELVEQELGRIAFFDPLALYKKLQSVDGAAPVFTLRALHEMPPDVRACIASIKIRNENLTSGDGVRDQTVELRFWDKIKALEICAKHLGYIDGKGGNISAKELLEFLEAGRRRNASRGASLVQPERAALGAGGVIDGVTVSPELETSLTAAETDDIDEHADEAGDLEI